jgi:opacity protein-like surface antigen
MRRWLAALCLIGFASQSTAGEFELPTLRGTTPFVPAPPRYMPWSGFYVGGQVGYGSTGINFTKGVQDLVANILRDTIVENEFQPSHWANLPEKSATRPNYGGFVGYNVQFEDIIFGLEANYNRTNMRVTSGDTIGRVVNTSDGYANAVTVSGTGTMHLTDYGTLRVRAGWANNGFIPYGFLGFAVGRADVTRSASVFIAGSDADPACVGPPDVCLPPYTFSQSQTESKKGVFGFGWAIGGGMDIAMFSNVFVRGELEYVSFPDFHGTSVGLASARVGAGIKF